MIGDYYGKWEVLKEAEGDSKRVWCRCECGYECAVVKKRLRAKLTTQCRSCAQKGPLNHEWQGVGAVPGTLYNNARRRARNDDIEFTISHEYIAGLYDNQRGCCALTGLPIAIQQLGGDASLDRIDSSKGYIPGNVQWVDKRVNYMKQALPEGEFAELCRLVYLNRKEKDDVNHVCRTGMFRTGGDGGGEVQRECSESGD